MDQQEYEAYRGRPTIRGDDNFKEDEETTVVEELNDAMKSCGTNEDKIIEILIRHNNYQRRRIAKAYEAAYGESLEDKLKSELSSDFEEVVLAMLKHPRELDAVMLHDAMEGLGTDERMLIGILATRTNSEIAEIKEYYKKLYDTELHEDLERDTSGHFCRMMRSLCTGFRQVEECDDDNAEKQAQDLIDAGIAQLGTDESEFNKVLCLSSPFSLRKILDKYRELRGTELEDDIRSEFDSNTADGFVAIIKLARNKNEFFAERLYNDTAGKFFGTNDAELIRILVSRSEIDLGDICDAFEAKYGQSLYDVVAGETSGDYQQTLLSLVKGEFVPKEC